MPYKSLTELVRSEICKGPASTFEERLISELRDFIAHEIMISDGLEGSNYNALLKLFNRLFKEPTKKDKTNETDI